MNGKTHLVVASTTVIAIAVINISLNSMIGLPLYPIAMIPLGAAGGFKADMDMDGNPEARDAKFALWVVRHIPFLKKVFEHRGITHTLLVPGLIYSLAKAMATGDIAWAVIFVISSLIGWMFGYCSHLFADLFNGKGIPLFWPLYWKRIHLASVTTDTYEESLFLVFWLILIISHTIMVYKGITL